MRVCLYVCPFIRSFVLETYTAFVFVETFQLSSCLHHFFSQGNLRALSRKRFRYDGSMTKRWQTKWHGQNGMDKIVYGENGITVLDKMVWAKCHFVRTILPRTILSGHSLWIVNTVHNEWQ